MASPINDPVIDQNIRALRQQCERLNKGQDKLLLSVNALDRQVASILSTVSGAPLSILSVLDSVYPVGTVYFTIQNANPNMLLGIGSWTKIADGTSLLGDITPDTVYAWKRTG